jgi:hypothetical protein
VWRCCLGSLKVLEADKVKKEGLVSIEMQKEAFRRLETSKNVSRSLNINSNYHDIHLAL